MSRRGQSIKRAFTKAGPVTVIKPDGTTEEKPAYSKKDLGRVRSGKKPRRTGSHRTYGLRFSTWS